MNIVQHLSHRHALKLEELSPDCVPHECYACGDRIHGSTYCCEECCLFLHKSCAEFPSETQHSVHPENPLTLVKDKPSLCLACREVSSFSFECALCGFCLDVQCALALLHEDPPFAMDTRAIRHFAHDHSLMLYHQKLETSLECKGRGIGKDRIFHQCFLCETAIDGRSFCCQGCNFFLHESCADLPPELQHPAHPAHPLALLRGKHSLKCSACQDISLSRLVFGCETCNFFLDFDCASEALPDKYPHAEESKAQLFTTSFHDHELKLYHVKAQNKIKCKACELPIKGKVYGCHQCLFFLHKRCAEVPSEIQHPIHPEHPLCFSRSMKFRCDSCQELHEDLAFICQSCNFNLDIGCALRTLSFLNGGGKMNIRSPIHDVHPVDICYVKAKHTTCEACKQIVRGLAYRCPSGDCCIVLHKSCAELPKRLEHPFHPLHPLNLLPDPSKDYVCSACSTKSAGPVFSCADCQFQLDVSCASQRLTVKHHLHRHELTYCKMTKHLECNICRGRGNADIYRCLPCNFNLHPRCLALPEKQSFHRHQRHELTLLDKYIEDDSGEYYCDECEQRRDPELGIYYCEQCDLRFDISCVIPKLQEMKSTEQSSLKEVNDKAARTREELEEVKKNVEALEAKLEACDRDRKKLNKFFNFSEV